MPIPLWIKEPILRRLYQRIGITYNSVGLPFALTKYLHKGIPMKLIDIGARTGEFVDVIEKYSGIERALLVEPQPDHGGIRFFRFHGIGPYKLALAPTIG